MTTEVEIGDLVHMTVERQGDAYWFGITNPKVYMVIRIYHHPYQDFGDRELFVDLFPTKLEDRADTMPPHMTCQISYIKKL